MARHFVPDALVIAGRPRQDHKNDTTKCQVCERLYVEHSGDICAICRSPVEHHDDEQRMADEIAGRARMARAKLVDEWNDLDRIAVDLDQTPEG